MAHTEGTGITERSKPRWLPDYVQDLSGRAGAYRTFITLITQPDLDEVWDNDVDGSTRFGSGTNMIQNEVDRIKKEIDGINPEDKLILIEYIANSIRNAKNKKHPNITSATLLGSWLGREMPSMSKGRLEVSSDLVYPVNLSVSS